MVYGRIYTVRKGYAYSETNNLIINLKKSPTASSSQLHYKSKAVQKFADEVIELFARTIGLYPNEFIALVPMPPSKALGHPEYDDRMDQVAQRIAGQFPNVRYWPVLEATRSSESAHKGGTRAPDQLHELIALNKSQSSAYKQGERVYILDDILTSGAHFVAARRRLSTCVPEKLIGGLFWAKAQELEELDEF